MWGWKPSIILGWSPGHRHVFRPWKTGENPRKMAYKVRVQLWIYQRDLFVFMILQKIILLYIYILWTIYSIRYHILSPLLSSSKIPGMGWMGTSQHCSSPKQLPENFLVQDLGWRRRRLRWRRTPHHQSSAREIWFQENDAGKKQTLDSLDWFKGKFTGNHGFYHQI